MACSNWVRSIIAQPLELFFITCIFPLAYAVNRCIFKSSENELMRLPLRQGAGKTKMNIILPHDHFDAAKLGTVKAEMRALGAPVIKAVNCGEFFVALEGSHRIRAAKELGFELFIEEVEYSETATTDEIVPGSYDDCWTIADVVDSAHNSIMITF
jgi:hypothetical protein